MANELLDCAKELREALAACFRVIYKQGGVPELEEEFRRIGIKDGLGVRVQEAIKRAAR